MECKYKRFGNFERIASIGLTQHQVNGFLDDYEDLVKIFFNMIPVKRESYIITYYERINPMSS